MVNYFINRPIFAWVLVIGLMLWGVLAIRSLPIAQYPSVAPPAISISGNYPGASAETVQNTVVQVVEQQLSGIDHLLYFSSESDKDGSFTITLSFEQGSNPDIAQVQVQNKLQLANPSLPQTVQQQGLRVAKSTKNFLMVVAFVSTDGKMTNFDIADYVASHIQDSISRTAGVGDFQLFGAPYAMRIWLDPSKLTNYALTPVDVANAIRDQNVQVASGELGGLPAIQGQELNATIVGPSLLTTPEEFGAIQLKVGSNGSRVLLRDVAKIELGSESYAVGTKYNGMPAAGLAVKLASGANALDTAKAVHATIAKFLPFLPPGLQVIYPYDTTPFIKISIGEVVKTLFEAIFLVFLVMYLFLQNFRATLVPTIAVPVVLLGTFGVLATVGYSINTLTMFALVLAIGLLVDDAIVVVENVERVMAEEGLSPKEATEKSMSQITGALVGIALVLSAVFLPMAFFGGSTGVIYRQFSITIVSAMILSITVAMIFTPALCATLLTPVKKGEHRSPNRFFDWFNHNFNLGNEKYVHGVARLLAKPGRYLMIYGALILITGLLYSRIAASFLPEEDQGIFFVQVNTPSGATTERTVKILDQVREYLLTQEADSVEGVFTVSGFSFGGRGQSSGLAFVRLKDWSKRPGAQHRAQAIAGRAMGHFFQIKDAMVFAFVPPALLELGNASGFDMELVDRAGLGHDQLLQARNQLLGMAAGDKTLLGVRPNGLNDEPQYKMTIDWEKAGALGIAVSDISNTLGSGWGSSYINQFIDRGRVKHVFIQGNSTSRMLPDDMAKWYVRNRDGEMVPFSAFSTAKWTMGSPKLERYNGVPSVELLGQPAAGKSTGEAMDAIDRLAQKLPPGIGYEWTGLSYEERLSGSQAPSLYAMSILVVFLCLAALYESWSIPLAVLMVVPLGIIGVILATLVRGLANDVFFQVGLLTTVGLSAKNAILIVEFAVENAKAGMSLTDATITAARQRLRPILMTSLAFMLGVLPLAISSGAGSGGRNAIGTGVLGGMLSATVLAIFFVPVFFVSVLHYFRKQPITLPQEDL